MHQNSHPRCVGRADHNERFVRCQPGPAKAYMHKTILVAIDLNDEACDKPLVSAVELARAFAAHLHVFTVVREVEAILNAKAATLGYEVIVADLENRLAALIRRVNASDLDPSILVAPDASIYAESLEIAEKAEADLIGKQQGGRVRIALRHRLTRRAISRGLPRQRGHYLPRASTRSARRQCLIAVRRSGAQTLIAQLRRGRCRVSRQVQLFRPARSSGAN
jgi:hypothetical protein